MAWPKATKSPDRGTRIVASAAADHPHAFPLALGVSTMIVALVVLELDRPKNEMREH